MSALIKKARSILNSAIDIIFESMIKEALGDAGGPTLQKIYREVKRGFKAGDERPPKRPPRRPNGS